MMIVHTTSCYEPAASETARRMSIAHQTWNQVYQSYRGIIIPGHQHVSLAARSSRTLGDDRDLPYIKDLIAFGFDSADPIVNAVMLTNADTCLIAPRMTDVIKSLEKRGCYFSLRYEHGRFEAPLAENLAARAPVYPGGDLFAVTRDWWNEHQQQYPDMLLGAEAWDGVLKALMMLKGVTAGRPVVYHEAHESYWSSHLLTSRSQTYNRSLARQWIQSRGLADFLCQPPVQTLATSVHSSGTNPDVEVRRFNELGVGMERAGRLPEAEGYFRKALERDPTYPPSWTNLATVQMGQGLHSLALESSKKALDLDADFRPAFNVIAAVHLATGNLREALQTARRAAELGVEHPESHANYGMLLLMAGDYANGWPEHEWRLKFPMPIHRRTGKRWDGSDPFGMTLLVYGDGGIGDVAQFARFIPLLQKRGARIIVECQPELMSIMGRVSGVWKVVPRGEASPSHDAYCSMVSLPALLKTTLQTLPSKVPYLDSEPERLERWAEVVRGICGFRVGVCWSGDPRSVLIQDRSFDPNHLEGFAKVEGVSLVSLQFRQPPPTGSPIISLPGLEADAMTLDNVAAVMQHLDLIISCDTGIAHLAGALGRPVWVALKKSACWRWMTNRSDSPWYPTMRLFRQKTAGEWSPVFDQMKIEIEAKVLKTAPAGASLPIEPLVPPRRPLETPIVF